MKSTVKYTFTLAALVLAPLTAFAAELARTPKPNVVVSLADDLGYGDLGIHGGKDVPTPYIDTLAASGGVDSKLKRTL